MLSGVVNYTLCVSCFPATDLEKVKILFVGLNLISRVSSCRRMMNLPKE